MSFFKRIRNNIDRKRLPRGDSESLFSLSSAYLTLEIKLGLKVTGRCAVTFKTVSGTFFYEMEQDVRQFLGNLQPEFDIKWRIATDSYGYMWIVFEGKRIEDILAGLTTVSDIVEERGFSDKLLAAVFEFSSIREEGKRIVSQQYLIYNYKRNNFYPFVPIGEKTIDAEQQMKIMATVREEIPFEKDMTLWYPLWDLPLRSQG
ncbi:MAG: PspA-associated protein PspAB [Nitrososphaera sp.]